MNKMPMPRNTLRIKPHLWPINKKELILEAPEERWTPIGAKSVRTVFKLRYRKILCTFLPCGYNLLMNWRTDKLKVGDMWLDIIGNAQYKGAEHSHAIQIKPGCHFNEDKFLVLDEAEDTAYFPYYDASRDSIGYTQVHLPGDALYKEPEDRGLLGCPGRQEKEQMKVEKAPAITPEEREKVKTIERAREGLKEVEEKISPPKVSILQRIVNAIAEFLKTFIKTKKR